MDSSKLHNDTTNGIHTTKLDPEALRETLLEMGDRVSTKELINSLRRKSINRKSCGNVQKHKDSIAVGFGQVVSRK
jgi:hypothetical protein